MLIEPCLNTVFCVFSHFADLHIAYTLSPYKRFFYRHELSRDEHADGGPGGQFGFLG